MSVSIQNIVGESEFIRDLRQRVQRSAQHDQSVLLFGERGAGKCLIAKTIHGLSQRAKQPFISFEIDSVAPESLETELFGAGPQSSSSVGKIEKAHGGTLYINSVEDLPMAIQAKILRFLETRQIEPVGAVRPIPVDVRLIVGTQEDLQSLVERKQFRQELLDVLQKDSIRVLSLRDRKSDLPILSKYFVRLTNEATGNKVEDPSAEILDALNRYDWPGNVAELKNLIERIAILKQHGCMDLADLPHRLVVQLKDHDSSGATASEDWDFPRMVLPEHGLDLKNVVTAFENHLVDQALARTHGNKNRASELLQMNRTTLVEKLRKRGMIKPAKQKPGVPAQAAQPSFYLESTELG